MEKLKKCKCGGIPLIVENNPSNYMALCKCGRRTNGCNNSEHAIFCWNEGFCFTPGAGKKVAMEKKIIKCSECEHCKDFRKVGNTRSSFTCEHPDREHIRKYYMEHRITKMDGFIGYGKPYSKEVPIKTSPAWCPKKKE